MSRTLTSY